MPETIIWPLLALKWLRKIPSKLSTVDHYNLFQLSVFAQIGDIDFTLNLTCIRPQV